MKRLYCLFFSLVLVFLLCSCSHQADSPIVTAKPSVGPAATSKTPLDYSIEDNSDGKENFLQYSVTPISSCVILEVNSSSCSVKWQSRCDYCGKLSAFHVDPLPSVSTVSSKQSFSCSCSSSSGMLQYSQYAVSVVE